MTKIEAMGYTTEDAKKVEEVIRDLARKAGVTADEAADAVYKILEKLPPIGEAEIAMIRCNPFKNGGLSAVSGKTKGGSRNE